MKPETLKTKIFLDGGDPKETKEIIELLGFLDGQTTNPTLIARSPGAKKRLESGDLFTQSEIYDYYHSVVEEISKMLPEGSVSIEVYADKETEAEAMCAQSNEMSTWISNAHIKFPITQNGLSCAREAIDSKKRVNMTLCFTQEQAAAVHAATTGAKKGDVFVSPFIGRLDDIEENGMSLIRNIMQMYRAQQSHVEVLAASIRTIDHFLAALHEEVDIITAPAKILREWAEMDLKIPGVDFVYDAQDLQEIPFENMDLNKEVDSFDITHELTDNGIEKFSKDWNHLIAE